MLRDSLSSLSNRIYESLWRCDIRETSLFWDDLQNYSWRRRLFWRSNFSLQSTHETIPGQNTIEPVLQVHVTRYLDISGIEMQIPSITTKDRKSWVLLSRRKNRYLEELRLNDPDHNPGSSELVNHVGLVRSVAKESEPCSTEMEQSGIKETHAPQFEIQTNPLYHSKKVFLLKKRSGMTFLPTSFSKETLFTPKSPNWSWDWYVVLINMKEKLTALFSGILWVQNYEKRSRKIQGTNSRTQSGCNTFVKGSNKMRFQYCMNSRRTDCIFLLFKDTLVGI